MPQHQLIGGILALSGVMDLVVLVLFVLPRLKGTKESKKIISLALLGGGMSFIVAGAVFAFAGAAWFG